MAEQQTIVSGQRTIARHPEKPDTDRWQGRVDHEAFRDRAWHGRTIEQVVRQMDQALGRVPEAAYDVTE